MRLLLLLIACDHTYLIRLQDYRVKGEIPAIRSEDGERVQVRAEKISLDFTHDSTVVAHGKTTRATTVAGGVLLGAGLLLSITGAILWGSAVNSQNSCEAQPNHFLCLSFPQVGQAILGAGAAFDLAGVLVMSIGGVVRSEERN